MAAKPSVVTDTNVLLNFATLAVDTRSSVPSGEDPLYTLLTTCDVHVPESVLGEVGAAMDDDDLLATAATAVMRAADHLTTHDVADRLTESLDYALDRGESHAIWLANDIGAALFATDEFGGSNYPIVALHLDDADRLRTTPHLLCYLTERGHLDDSYVSAALSYLAETKGWDQRYVDTLRRRYVGR